jgi:protein-tyrosine kinase
MTSQAAPTHPAIKGTLQPQTQGLPLQGAPPLPTIAKRRLFPATYLLHADDLDDPRTEQIRMLRTELLLRHDASDPDAEEANIMALLSPGVAEGRSQLSAELAIAFAQLGQPTLLVDADLRNPRQHVLFNADNTWGLSHALTRAQPPQLQTVTDMPMLSLLTAGPRVANPLELLSARAFEELVNEWRRTFAFIIVDTPPAGRYGDGLAVATIIGRVLSLSRASHTSCKDNLEMLRRLTTTRSRVLGAVISRF